MAVTHGEVPSVARLFRYYAGWCDKIQGKTIPIEGILVSFLFYFSEKDLLCAIQEKNRQEYVDR